MSSRCSQHCKQACCDKLETCTHHSRCSLVALQVQHRGVQARAGPLVRLQPAVRHSLHTGGVGKGVMSAGGNNGLCLARWGAALASLQACTLAGCSCRQGQAARTAARRGEAVHQPWLCPACIACAHLHVVLGPRLVHEVEHHRHFLRGKSVRIQSTKQRPVCMKVVHCGMQAGPASHLCTLLGWLCGNSEG